MEKKIAYSSSEYQELFHRFAKITNVTSQEGYTIYENGKDGIIVSFGNPETIQCGIGDYTVEGDFSIEYHYDTRFLHFGIIYEGVTYSIHKGSLIASSIPSTFMSLEKMDKGTGIWRAGQHFKGVEFSINYDYLIDVLLPRMNKDKSCLKHLKINTRYSLLSPEITAQLSKIEGYIQKRIMTEQMALACGMELIELLTHPSSLRYFDMKDEIYVREIDAGKRVIKITPEDILKINKVREIIVSSAYDFKTIPMLAKEVGLSEQKLKYGFQDYYKQTIWNYQNNIRMARAAWLIREGDKNFDEISKAVGYHSQTAFYNAFKKWCGLSPGQFKKYLKQSHEN